MLFEVLSASLNTKELFNTLKRCSVVIAGSVCGRECQDFVGIPILSLVGFFLNLSGLWISHRGKRKAIASASPWPESFTVPSRVRTACLVNKWGNNCISSFFASPVFPTPAQPVHVVLDPQDIVLFTTLPRICSWQQSMQQRQHQSSRQMHLAGTAQRFTQTLLTQQCSLGGLLKPGALLLVLVRVQRGLRTPWPWGCCVQCPPGAWGHSFKLSLA